MEQPDEIRKRQFRLRSRSQEVWDLAAEPALSGRWLVKFAPFRTPWSEIVRRGTFALRGVRNTTACKNLSRMRLGDLVLYYHSQQERSVVGVMEVTRTAYPDPTSADPRWLTCDFAPVQSLPVAVPLARIKREPALATFPVLRQPRVAVLPLTAFEFLAILRLASAPIPDVPLDRQAPLVALVDHILAAKRADPAADIATLEAELDRLVSGLYGLAAPETGGAG